MDIFIIVSQQGTPQQRRDKQGRGIMDNREYTLARMREYTANWLETVRTIGDGKHLIYGAWSKSHNCYIYVGKTKYILAERVKKHKYAVKKSDAPLYQHIRENGWNDIVWHELKIADNCGDITEHTFADLLGTYDMCNAIACDGAPQNWKTQ